MQLLDHTGEIFSKTTGARRGGSRFWGDEIQVFIIGDLVEVVPVLQQLPAHVLGHLLQGTKQSSAGWTHIHALGVMLPTPARASRGQGDEGAPGDPTVSQSEPHTCLSRGVSRGTPGSWLAVTEGKKKQSWPGKGGFRVQIRGIWGKKGAGSATPRSI